MPGPSDHDSPPGIRQAVPADRNRITALLSTAFHDHPVTSWLIPDPARRAGYADTHFARVTAAALSDPHARVHVTADGAAAAIWYEHDHDVTPARIGYGFGLPTPVDAVGATAARVALLHQLLLNLEAGIVHHHLIYLAVHPTRRRQRLAAALLRHHQLSLDAAGKPAAATAYGSAALALFDSQGYRRSQTDSLHNGIQMTGVWRPPTPPPAPLIRQRPAS